MGSKLDELLDRIRHERTLEEAERRADEALNTFECTRALITDWEGFRGKLVRLLRHVECRGLRLQPSELPDMGIDFDWSRCSRILKEAYGPSGEKAAFEMARTGNEQGLYRVLRDLAHHLAKEFAENEIAARVLNYWNGLTVEERFAAAKAFVDRFHLLLPTELVEKGAFRIVANMPKVLQEHPRLLQRLRRAWRS